MPQLPLLILILKILTQMVFTVHHLTLVELQFHREKVVTIQLVQYFPIKEILVVFVK